MTGAGGARGPATSGAPVAAGGPAGPGDVLAAPSPGRATVAAEVGLVVLHRRSGLRGRVQRLAGGWVEVLDARGRRHQLRNLPGAFAWQGETVTLVAPAAATPSRPTRRRSAAGSLVVDGEPARVARASRLWVEGDHDARLLERVWGDDLREMAVVVEPLGGIDHLPRALEEFGPGPGRQVVVLVDHLVDGSREQRLARQVQAPHVHVVGHPFVDVWQCVRPAAVGIGAWPEVPPGEDWKLGVCARLGWGTPQEAWRRVLAAVDSFADLEAELVRAVEVALDLLSGDG